MAALTTHRVQVRLGPVVRRVRVAAIPRLAVGQLAAAALCLSISVGALSVVASISGAGAAASQGSASLSVGRPLSATTAAPASSTGDLAVVRGLNASTLAVAQTGGTLQVANGISGASSATSQAVGALTVQRDLTAAAIAQSASTGAISATVSPSASTNAQSTSAGSATVERSLAGSAAALSVTSAVLTVSKGFDGASVATSTTAGDLTVARPVGANTSALSVAAAALTVTKGLSAMTSAPAVAVGTLTAGGGEDADAASYLNAQTTPPSSAERSLVGALVKGLKTDGDWASLDWILLLASETAQAARLNLRNPTKSASAINLPTFTANRGYMGDGASSYLDFNEGWAASGNQFALNSAAIGVWCNLQGAPGVKSPVGNLANSPRDTISARDTAGNETIQINQTAADILQTTPGTRTGHRSISRMGANIVSGFFNGSKVLTSTTVSTNVNTTNISALRSGTGYTDDRLALIYFGAGLSDVALARIHNRFNTYLTAKGAA